MFFTQEKLDLIQQSIAAGAKRLEVASFAHPKYVPQIADEEAVIEGLHFATRNALIDLPREFHGPVKIQNPLPRMSRTRGEVPWSGLEKLGPHTEEVVTEFLGLTSEQFQKLRDSQIV